MVARNKERATIEQTTQVPIQTATIANGATTQNITFKELKLQMDVTPQITFDGQVILDVTLERSFPGATSSNGQFEVETRKAKSTVMVKNGKTAVFGGIYQFDDRDGDTGIPVLKDIPLLGYLFKRTTLAKSKNELLLFLKPKILKEIDGPMVSKSGPPGESFNNFEEVSVDEGGADGGAQDSGSDIGSDEDLSEDLDSEFLDDSSADDEELTL